MANMAGGSTWLRSVLLIGIVYIVVGIVTAHFATSASSIQVRNLWRLTAWVLSLLVFLGHVARERLRARCIRPRGRRSRARLLGRGQFLASGRVVTRGVAHSHGYPRVPRCTCRRIHSRAAGKTRQIARLRSSHTLSELVPVHPRIQELVGYLDWRRAELEKAVSAVPAARRERRPGAGRWSVGEVLEHLTLVETRIRLLLDGRLTAARPAGLRQERDTAPVLPTLGGTRLLDRSPPPIAT